MYDSEYYLDDDSSSEISGDDEYFGDVSDENVDGFLDDIDEEIDWAGDDPDPDPLHSWDEPTEEDLTDY